MHKLKAYVSESIIYGNDDFSSWLLIPSRPDDFLVFQPRYVFASFRNGEVWDNKWVLSFVCRNHVEDLSTHIHLLLVLLMILTQTGNDY